MKTEGDRTSKNLLKKKYNKNICLKNKLTHEDFDIEFLQPVFLAHLHKVIAYKSY